ncbi:sn-glycerol-1-phosphate dehydrogenase [Paenibacillus thailandensis]|uniref:Sn-glycerol-1-phosphate dehydrogenase n=1 Tax=Paenibacillus thailandensis TaxID=393250 RepID=A0ABW5QSH3_9BACL
MSELMAYVREQAARLEGFDPSAIDIGPVLLEAGALNRVAPYLKEQGYRKVIVAADATTIGIAGRVVEQAISGEGIEVSATIIRPNELGDVIADEQSLIQLILDVRSRGVEAIIAVGSGTLHDISRMSAYATGIPFISVPTAPSVDGFNSKGAPIILRGDKQTIQSVGPDAIFADLDILTKAPPALIAAGFGDMLGKYTSLFDWEFGALTGGEAYSPVIADMTRKALSDCVQHVDEIAARTPEGIRLLTGALLESGFAMLLFGQSHPASGAEHHLSHYWETSFLRTGRRQILHGAKVGVACAEISGLYHRLADEDKLPVEDPDKKARIKEAIASIPRQDMIRGWLAKVGGPNTLEQLGVDNDLFERSLKEAHLIRLNRHTLLRAYNELKS